MHPADGVLKIIARRYNNRRRRTTAEHELAECHCQQIEWNDGEGVGVQGREQRQRQVDAEQDAADGSTQHLQWPRNQAAIKPHRNGTRCRMTIQMPQAGMQQCVGERRQPAIAMNGLVAGQIASDQFAHDCPEF